jgi:hypothetical protein
VNCEHILLILFRIELNDSRTASYITAIEDLLIFTNGEVDLVMAVLPNNRGDTYASIKRKCSVDHGGNVNEMIS